MGLVNHKLHRCHMIFTGPGDRWITNFRAPAWFSLVLGTGEIQFSQLWYDCHWSGGLVNIILHSCCKIFTGPGRVLAYGSSFMYPGWSISMSFVSFWDVVHHSCIQAEVCQLLRCGSSFMYPGWSISMSFVSFWDVVHHSCIQAEVSVCRLSAFEMWFIIHVSRMKCQYAVSELCGLWFTIHASRVKC